MAEKNKTMTGLPRLRGFSLIEVLIALIVMSVGMLGIAGLYVHSMQAGRTSLFRHNAVTLAGDVADRIRANPLAGTAYADTGPVTTPPATDCISVDCSAAEMATNDIYLWDRQADSTLPDGDVRVDYDDSAVPSEYTVTVTWREAGYEDDPEYAIVFPVFEMTP